MILGNSLLVMASLAEKEGLKGKVQMIYMDPPYGINFNSNWQVRTTLQELDDPAKPDDDDARERKKRDVVSREPEVIKAFQTPGAVASLLTLPSSEIVSRVRT